MKVELVNQNLAMAQRDNNEGYGVVKLPVKVYGGNPTEFMEFMSEYHQMAKAHGFFEKTMIQRLPIYLKGMARGVFYSLEPVDKETLDVL